MNSMLLFIIPFIASMSTVVGYFFTYFPSKYQTLFIPFSLAFAGGVMFILSFCSLLPESFTFSSSFSSLVFGFLLGVLFFFLFDRILSFFSNLNSLHRIGLLSFFVLLLHNIPEGITTYLTSSVSISLGVSFAIGIAFHNIPEGICIAIPIFYSTASRNKAFFYTFFAGISEFLGALLAYLFLSNISSSFMSILLSMTAGIMTSITFIEILPTSFSYHKKMFSYIGFILGIVFMLIII